MGHRWSHRNGTQSIQANATRFPNGIKAVADYVHALGALLHSYRDGSFTTTDSHLLQCLYLYARMRHVDPTTLHLSAVLIKISSVYADEAG